LWREIKDRFYRQMGRLLVVRKMIELGIRVGEDGRLYVGDVAVDYTALAKAAGIDRRVVQSTVRQILEDRELRDLFTRIRPVGASLVEVADRLGYSVLVIGADPHLPGIIAGVTGILAEYNIVVRQALADDPDLVPEPKLTLVIEGRVPGEALERIQALPQVKSLTLLK
jgi:hypothetical protein